MRISFSFFTWALVALIMNVRDMLSTYFVTPDLADEGNYWVQNHSFGWVGLTGVLVFYQMLYLAALYFHTNVFKTPQFNKRRNNSFIEVLRIYFVSDPEIKDRSKIFGNIIKGLFNYLGYYGIRFYIASKLLAVTDNLLVGLLLRNSTVTGVSNGVKDISIDASMPFWSSTIGKVVLWYSQYSLASRIAFQNLVLLILGTFILLYFVFVNYRKAISIKQDAVVSANTVYSM